MIEQLAKEHKHYSNNKELQTAYEWGYKDGVEFGYNKCFEQIQKLVNEHTRLDCIIPELLKLKEQ